MALTRRAKIAVLSAGLVLFFLGVALVALPNVLVNRPQTKATLARYLGESLGGAVGFERLALSLFPRPCVTARDVRLDLPERLAGSAAEIDICLKLLPLLQGRVAVDSARLRSPDILLPFGTARLGADPAPKPNPRRILSTAVAALQRIPDGALEILDARLAFSLPDGRRLELSRLNLQAQRRGAGLQWELTGRSEFLGAFSSTGRIDLDAVQGPLSIQVSDFRPQTIYALLWPNAPWRLADARANLEFALDMQGPDRFKAGVKGRLPVLNLRRLDQEVHIQIDRLAAEMDLSPRILSIRVPEFSAGLPRAVTELSLVVDEDRRPRMVLDVKGRGDVGGLRQTTLALLSGMPDAKIVFDILRGGEVSDLQARLQGNTWPELTDLPNLMLQGRLEKGRVHLPWIGLDLDEVSGDALISGGVLEGRNLKACHERTRGENGTLRVGLSSSQPVLELDILTRADLSPLPALLARWVPDSRFRREIARIQEFSGTARGSLRLNGTRTDVGVEVQASELDVKARLQDLPYPLRVQGGAFSYAGSAVTLRGVDVAVGNSVLYQHDMTLGLTGDLPVEASTPRAVIDLEQAFDLFRRRPAFNHMHRLAGIITANRCRLTGQLLDPATWNLDLSGAVQDLFVESGLLPGLLSLPSSRFDWLGRTIRYESASGSVGRSGIRGLAIEADYSGPPRAQFRALEVAAALEDLSALMPSFPKAAEHAARFDPLTGTLRMRDVRLQTRRIGDDLIADHFKAVVEDSLVTSGPLGLSLGLGSGNIAWKGSRLELQVAKASLGKSKVENLSLTADRGFDGGLALRADGAIIDCDEWFQRLLPLAGLERLREDLQSVRGALNVSRLTLEGPIRDPHRWRVQAVSEFKDVIVATTFLDEPIELPLGRLTVAETGAPEAGRTALRLDAAHVRSGAGEVVLAGDIALSAADIAIDLDLSAEVVDWNTLAKISERLALRRKGDSRPVRGSLNLRLERLVIDRVHFYPAHAQVRLAPEGARIDIARAGFCGMPFIGRIAFDGPMVDAFLVPVVDVMSLDGVIYCLSEEKSIVSGNFNLDGELRFKARLEDVLAALNGRLTFVAEDGTIQQFLFFARLFSLLNLTEIYRGKLPDLSSQGLEYKRSTAQIELKDGKILVNDWSIDGRTVWIGSRGEIDIATQAIDFTVMVSPFKTFDRIINSIPGLRWILGGRLLAVPMKAVGHLGDPQIIPLAPSAVGTSLLEMFERTLLLPIEIIQPLIPGIEEGPSGTISR
jgi:hypothetical protein